VGGARADRSQAAERLRHQAHRRRLHPPFLGGEPRPDLPRAEAGSAALQGWLAGHETRVELRDESLLRIFFSDAVPREHGLGLIAARREGYRQMLVHLESLDDGTGPDPTFVDVVYRWGLDYCRWGIEWCDAQLERLQREEAA
jgi:hypothetical protein